MQAIKTVAKILLMLFVVVGVVAACATIVIFGIAAIRFLPVLAFFLLIIFVLWWLVRFLGIRIESDRL